jgi:aspartate dehydrogenase
MAMRKGGGPFESLTQSYYGRIAAFPGNCMRIALIGAGTIARLVLENIRRGELGQFRAVALMGRPGGAPRGAALAREFGVPYVEDRAALLAARPQTVIEAASHQAVRAHLVALLEAGTGVVVLSAGALVDDALREAAERAAARANALFYVPSGGIGGLDALKTACLAGVDEVSIQVAKPPAAWKGIAYVEERGFRLDALTGPLTLFEGSALEGVPHFPQNVNIAAILSLAGIGAGRTRLKVVADPALELNTHTIRVSGRAGRMTVVLENVPAPENPKTSWLACYSALAALKSLAPGARYGT